MKVTYPRRPELVEISRQHGYPFKDAVRDVVRLVAIAEMCERGFLNEDCVLVGGMALRLRGSNRFTIFDTDSSARRPTVGEQEIRDGLALTSDDLEIDPADPAYWTTNKSLQTAKPINYRAYFAGTATNPIEGEFSLTVNQRGLNMETEWLDLRTPYPSLAFDPPIKVPVMHLVEQTAEKILAWCGASLMKHYVDLGWIAENFSDELDAGSLREQCEQKLDTNTKLFAQFEHFSCVGDLIEPLEKPDRYVRPLNTTGEQRAEGVRFLGNAMTPDRARQLVDERIVPLLR